MAVYKNCGPSPAMSARECPIGVGRILRLVSESSGLPYVVIESWWPLLKPAKYEGRPNVFGTWIPRSKPIVESTAGPPHKKPATSRKGPGQVIVSLTDVLAWPIDLDKGNPAFSDGGRIPFTALHYLRSRHGVDLSHHTFSFAKRRKAFYMECVAAATEHVRAEQRNQHPH